MSELTRRGVIFGGLLGFDALVHKTKPSFAQQTQPGLTNAQRARLGEIEARVADILKRSKPLHQARNFRVASYENSRGSFLQKFGVNLAQLLLAEGRRGQVTVQRGDTGIYYAGSRWVSKRGEVIAQDPQGSSRDPSILRPEEYFDLVRDQPKFEIPTPRFSNRSMIDPTDLGESGWFGLLFDMPAIPEDNFMFVLTHDREGPGYWRQQIGTVEASRVDFEGRKMIYTTMDTYSPEMVLPDRPFKRPLSDKLAVLFTDLSGQVVSCHESPLDYWGVVIPTDPSSINSYPI